MNIYLCDNSWGWAAPQLLVRGSAYSDGRSAEGGGKGRRGVESRRFHLVAPAAAGTMYDAPQANPEIGEDAAAVLISLYLDFDFANSYRTKRSRTRTGRPQAFYNTVRRWARALL